MSWPVRDCGHSVAPLSSLSVCFLFHAVVFPHKHLLTMFHVVPRLTYAKHHSQLKSKNWNVASFSAKASSLWQTSLANGRLIAGEIEYESQFPLWIRNSRLLFKMVCRCFQIWHEKGLDGAQPNFCAVPLLSTVKHLAEDLNFWWNPRSCDFCFINTISQSNAAALSADFKEFLQNRPVFLHQKHARDFPFLGLVRISFPLMSNPSTSGKPSLWTSDWL